MASLSAQSTRHIRAGKEDEDDDDDDDDDDEVLVNKHIGVIG